MPACWLASTVPRFCFGYDLSPIVLLARREDEALPQAY
jgi:hypothetical protein